MSNINQTQNLFALDTVQDLDDETAATCSGGANVILYEHKDAKGDDYRVNTSVGGGVSNLGSGLKKFNDKTSSIIINDGFWMFFSDSNYKGQSTGLLGPGYYNLGANNDKITSFRRVG